ncbi:OmpP1/FadL family transporter [Wenyingzhuangia sp. IMCC45467]
MKNYIYICLLSLIGYQVQAQSYNYTDLGILFSTDNNTETARATALNGSLGAVGGDLSSININPAGIAVFNNGEVSATLGSYNFNNSTNYYNNSLDNSSTTFNLNQVGAVFVFKDAITTNDWSKVSFAVNYQKTANYHTRNAFFGNSGFASYITHPNDPDTNNTYENAISQDFYNYIDGTASKINLALAGQYGNNFYAGFSLNIHHINFSQSTTLNELSEDNNGNTLDVLATEDLTENADGFSINLGFIYKPIQSVRLGLAYQSPTWYNFTEDYSSQELIASIPSENIDAADPFIDSSYLEYRLRTPGKITASGALVIGKMGFINLDYKYDVYKSLNLNGSSNFRNDNQYYTNILQNTHNVNIGGEFRLQNLSLRGGFGYQQSPFKSNLDPRDTDILKLGDQYSGSLGAGIRFGPSRLDIAYRRTVQDNEYDFNDLNQQFQYIESAKTNNKNSRVVATYTYSF